MNLNHPELYPGVCMVCRRAPETNELFVDTYMQSKINVRPERVYLCPHCGGQIALALGYVPGAEVEAAKAEIAEIEAALDALDAITEDHAAVFDVLTGALTPDEDADGEE